MQSPDYEAILKQCVDKLRLMLDEFKSVYPRFPHTCSGGKWKTSGDEEWRNVVDGYWTGGFWVGLLLLAHRLTGEAEFLEWGRKWFDVLAPRAEVKGMHDLGFLFFPSAVIGCEVCGIDEMREPALTAAANLADRYSQEYRAITIFKRPPLDRTIAIDTMMNLPLLWWAARETGNSLWRRIAENHVETTAARLVRDDGSTNHILIFERGDRGVDGIESWQGRAPDSCWSRGQAWAISGAAYGILLGESDACNSILGKLLNYYESHLPDDMIPYWDLDVEQVDAEPRDASAAVIAVHALLQMCETREYTFMARAWLDSVASRCVASPDRGGLIDRVCFHRPAGEDVDCSSMFADFYFLCALALAAGRLDFIYRF